MTERLEKLTSFLDALDEWGCNENQDRAKHILDFQDGGYDLSAYSDGPTPAYVAPTVAWRFRQREDGPHMWEYYHMPARHSWPDHCVVQKLTLGQLIDILNDDKHANAQERPPEPHAPSYLEEAFREGWKMANTAGAEDDWEDAFSFWRPAYAGPVSSQSNGNAEAMELLAPLKEATLALEGLAKGEGVFKPIEQTIVLARAAIAKAEGRSS